MTNAFGKCSDIWQMPIIHQLRSSVAVLSYFCWLLNVDSVAY